MLPISNQARNQDFAKPGRGWEDLNQDLKYVCLKNIPYRGRVELSANNNLFSAIWIAFRMFLDPFATTLAIKSKSHEKKLKCPAPSSSPYVQRCSQEF